MTSSTRPALRRFTAAFVLVFSAGTARAGEPAPKATNAEAPLSDVLTGSSLSDYNAGLVAYQDKDYAGALLKFQSAYHTARDPRLLWNMATCEKELRHYAAVLELVRRYESESGSALSGSRREEADRFLEAVSEYVGELTVVVSQPDADIAIDGAHVGKSPLSAPLMVTHGNRKLTVTKTGFETYSEDVVIKGRSSLSVQVKLSEVHHVGNLAVVAGRGDAIRVDGALQGTGEWRGSLSSGTHRVNVTAEDKTPYDGSVTVRDGQTESLHVTLSDKSSSKAWIWITGGVAVAAGLAVGGYFLFRSDKQEAKPGTLPPGSIELPLRF